MSTTTKSIFKEGASEALFSALERFERHENGKPMLVRDIIEELKKCDPDAPIQVFDERSFPYSIVDVYADTTCGGTFSQIEIRSDCQ